MMLHTDNKVIAFNARIIVNKWFKLIKEIFSDYNSSILTLSKTWFNYEPNDGLITECGLAQLRSNKVDRRGSGVLLMIKNSLKPLLVLLVYKHKF